MNTYAQAYAAAPVYPADARINCELCFTVHTEAGGCSENEIGHEPCLYDNAAHLDRFYIEAAVGVDYETGEVVDMERALASYRDDQRYGRFATPIFDQACVCACQCGNRISDQEAYIVSFGICDDCDYCGPRHGCEHPQHPHFRPTWPN